MKTLKEHIKEAIRKELKEDSPSQNFYKFRELGVSPDNTPSTSKYILATLKPGGYYVDLSLKLWNKPAILKYVGKERSIYTFDILDIKTKKPVGMSVDIQRGNLAKLRTAVITK